MKSLSTHMKILTFVTLFFTLNNIAQADIYYTCDGSTQAVPKTTTLRFKEDLMKAQAHYKYHSEELNNSNSIKKDTPWLDLYVEDYNSDVGVYIYKPSWLEEQTDGLFSYSRDRLEISDMARVSLSLPTFLVEGHEKTECKFLSVR